MLLVKSSGYLWAEDFNGAPGSKTASSGLSGTVRPLRARFARAKTFVDLRAGLESPQMVSYFRVHLRVGSENGRSPT